MEEVNYCAFFKNVEQTSLSFDDYMSEYSHDQKSTKVKGHL